MVKLITKKSQLQKTDEVDDVKYYDELYASSKEYKLFYKNSFYYPVWSQVIAFVRKLPFPKILEIGCGAGQFAHYLYDEGYRSYHGFDLSARAIKIAKNVVKQSFSIGDAIDKNCYNYDYNLVITLETLEHIKDDFSVLNNIKEGTAIIFSLPRFTDPKHCRYFKSRWQILSRYYRYIYIKEIIRIDKWFVCYGIVQKFEPKLLNLLLKTRKDFNIKYVMLLFKKLKNI